MHKMLCRLHSQTLVFSVGKNKSLIQILNKSDPSTAPCGTPKSISVHLPKPVLSLVLCHLLVK